jgi:hypothetical protein
VEGAVGAAGSRPLLLEVVLRVLQLGGHRHVVLHEFVPALGVHRRLRPQERGVLRLGRHRVLLGQAQLGQATLGVQELACIKLLLLLLLDYSRGHC